jgi:hypothetical protein
MKGYIEIKEDSYEDTIEHLYRIKKLACKLIDKLAESSEVYEDEETEVSKVRRGRYVY